MESEFLQHEPCPECGSRDNLGRYSDGHAHCFGCGYREKGDGDGITNRADGGVHSGNRGFALVHGEPRALSKRKLTLETAERWKYWVGQMSGKTVQIANYLRGGRIVAQKVRFRNKDMRFLGDTKDVGLYGEWMWRDGGRMVVVTEGELDALTVSQLQGHKWPVVSVPNGAQGAAKAIKKRAEYLEQFARVVFMFDMDEPGRTAAEECAALLTPGKAHIAHLPLKDPNEMLKAGRGPEIIDAMWGAKVYRPDGIVSTADLKAKAVAPVQWGLSWPWEPLTKLTYGIRRKELYALGAGTGVGKTDVFTEVMAHLVQEHGLRVGAIMLEQPPEESLRRIAGKIRGRRFHVPDADWKPDELMEAIDDLVARDAVYLYDHFGSSEWDIIKSRIRYMVQSLDIKDVFLDHLTALVAGEADERRALEGVMAEMAQLTQELDFTLYFISHLATPDAKPHEEGGRVYVRHFKGSRAIGFWSHFMFGLERNQQAEDLEVRHTTTLRVLKDRYTGQATGECLFFRYDADTGRLSLGEDCPSDVDDDKEEF